jgi:hypothetical protein
MADRRLGAVARHLRVGAPRHAVARQRPDGHDVVERALRGVRPPQPGGARTRRHGLARSRWLGDRRQRRPGRRADARHVGPAPHGVLCDAACIGRFYDFLERRGGRWGLVLRQPIYERDRLDPVDPTITLELDADLLGDFPEGYRTSRICRRRSASRSRVTCPTSVVPPSRPFYASGRRWLEGSPLHRSYNDS